MSGETTALIPETLSRVDRTHLHRLGLDDTSIASFFGRPDREGFWPLRGRGWAMESESAHESKSTPTEGDEHLETTKEKPVTPWTGPRYEPGSPTRMPPIASYAFCLGREGLEERVVHAFVKRQGFRYRDPKKALRADPTRLKRESVRWLMGVIFDEPAILSWALGGASSSEILAGCPRGQLNAVRAVIADHYPHLAGAACADMDLGLDSSEIAA